MALQANFPAAAPAVQPQLFIDLTLSEPADLRASSGLIVLLPVFTIGGGGDREDVVLLFPFSQVSSCRLQAAPRPAVASSVGCFPDLKRIDSLIVALIT